MPLITVSFQTANFKIDTVLAAAGKPPIGSSLDMIEGKTMLTWSFASEFEMERITRGLKKIGLVAEVTA